MQKLLSVDNDVSNKLNELALHPEPLQLMADAFQKALEENKKIYFYGCGATGRLGKFNLKAQFGDHFGKGRKQVSRI